MHLQTISIENMGNIFKTMVVQLAIVSQQLDTYYTTKNFSCCSSSNCITYGTSANDGSSNNGGNMSCMITRLANQKCLLLPALH